MQRVAVEENILQRALNALREETGLIAHVFPKKFDAFPMRWDGEIKLVTPDLKHEFFYFVEIKKRVTQAAIGAIEYQFKETKERGLLVTEYVPPLLAFKLKTLGIQFIDACGNAYINAFPLYIFVKGNKRVTHEDRLAFAPRAFRPTGLKVLFALLCNPGLENMPFRHIAMMTNVALGTVNAVFKNLKATGYLIDKGRFGRKLLQKDKLLERWITTYPEALRPKIRIGRYTAKDKCWWENAILPELYYWGGEVAAAKITKYLKPEIVTVYTHKPPGLFLMKNKLRKDPNGPIEILKAFWGKDQIWHNKDIVHPLLVYADLVATTDARNHETAKIIFKNELYKLVR